jgi:hypothetical protein
MFKVENFKFKFFENLHILKYNHFLHELLKNYTFSNIKVFSKSQHFSKSTILFKFCDNS